MSRIDSLRRTGAAIKFLSLEPLPGPDLRGIDWVIVGGESGPGPGPVQESWVLDIRDQCRQVGVPFFLKQWGGVHRKKAGQALQGRTWDGMPAVTLAQAPINAPGLSFHSNDAKRVASQDDAREAGLLQTFHHPARHAIAGLSGRIANDKTEGKKHENIAQNRLTINVN